MSAGRVSVAVAVAAVVAVGLAVVLLTGGSEEGPDRAGVRTVPASIPADCSRNVQDALGRFIAGVPDGMTVRFRPGGCYAADNRIEVRDKTGLTIDGNGSTFRSSAENTGKRAANPTWLLLRGRDLVITDMKIVGNFHLTGIRSQQRVNQASTEGEAGATSQPNAGIGIYGGRAITVRDVDIRDVFGDGVLTGVSEYVDGSVPSQTPRDVRVERVTVTKAARHCFSPNQVVGFRLEDSAGRDCWYGALDAELDDPSQQLQDVHIVGNTFAGFNLLGIFVPVAGDGENTRDLEIRDNTFLTPPDQPCSTIIEVGAYPKNPNTIRNVVVEANTMKAHGVAVALDHVRGGRIRDNRIDYEEKGCTHPHRTPPVRLTNSSGVSVRDNPQT
jgi:hypothetical protein